MNIMVPILEQRLHGCCMIYAALSPDYIIWMGQGLQRLEKGIHIFVL
jgi:hypothetical protein